MSALLADVILARRRLDDAHRALVLEAGWIEAEGGWRHGLGIWALTLESAAALVIRRAAREAA